MWIFTPITHLTRPARADWSSTSSATPTTRTIGRVAAQSERKDGTLRTTTVTGMSPTSIAKPDSVSPTARPRTSTRRQLTSRARSARVAATKTRSSALAGLGAGSGAVEMRVHFDAAKTTRPPSRDGLTAAETTSLTRGKSVPTRNTLIAESPSCMKMKSCPTCVTVPVTALFTLTEPSSDWMDFSICIRAASASSPKESPAAADATSGRQARMAANSFISAAPA